MKDFTKVVDLNWFATRNFHGQWYADSDELENYLHFRSGRVDDFIEELRVNAPLQTKLAKYVPSFIIKKFVMEPVANKPLGTMHWIKNNETDRITAFFGSKQKWEGIPEWETYTPQEPSKTPVLLNHGYDENKPKSEMDLNDMKEVAVFRGGKCLSNKMEKGDLQTKLTWRCCFGHDFEASPILVLLGGHWCPDCLPAPWNYDEEAKHNPFFAQVWYPLHDRDEDNYYSESIIKSIPK